MLGFFEKLDIQIRIEAGIATNEDAKRLLDEVMEQRMRVALLCTALLDAQVALTAISQTASERATKAERMGEKMERLARIENSTD